MDYYIYYYSLQDSKYLSRKYFVLPGNKKLIRFYYEVGSKSSIFPLKVFVNDDQVTTMKTLYGKKQYHYSTNKPGNYSISVLSRDKILSPSEEIVYTRNHINDFFPTFQPDDTCVYYTKNGYFRYSPNNFVNLNYIEYTVSKHYFTLFFCRFCLWNIFYYYHSTTGFLDSSGTIQFDSKDYKRDYREGFVDIVFRSGNDFSFPLLHKERVFFTNVRTPYVTYSFNVITIKAICLLDNLKIRRMKTNEYYSLSCDNTLSRKGFYYCEPNVTLTYGLYFIYYNDIYTDYTYISEPIENAELILNTYETKVGRNYINITSTNFVLDTVYKVVVKDNDAQAIIYFWHYQSYIKPPFRFFYALTIGEKNYLEFYLTAHPGKIYNIQLFNSKGKSKIIQLGKKVENISFSLKRSYYVINTNESIVPSFTVKGDYAQNIQYIFYRNEKEYFKNYNYMNGTDLGEDSKIFNFRVPKKGTYFFAFSLYDDPTKFEILNNKVVAGDTIMDIALFFPPGNTILKTMDYSFDIIPRYTFSINVFITYHQFSEDNLIHLVDFSRKRGESNYDAKKEDISRLDTQTYRLIIQEVSSGNLLYIQDLTISNFYFNDAYYIDNGYITVYNANNYISDLYITSNDNDEEYQLKIFNQELKSDRVLCPIPKDIILNKKAGYYIVDLDASDVQTIFLSNSLLDSTFIIYPISGNNNVVIKSKNYYLQFLTHIVLYNNDTNDEIIYSKSDITFENNDYLYFTLPNTSNKPNYTLKAIIEKCPKSPQSNCTLNLNQALIYDSPISFEYETNYQIPTNQKTQIVFKFTNSLTKAQFNYFISLMYIDNKLKVLNPETESCTMYKNNYINCTFDYPGETKIITINYNEFSQTEKTYTYIYYDYDGENCLIEGEQLDSYQLNIGDSNYPIYFNNEQLTKNSTTKNYTIDMSKAINGLNEITLQLTSTKNISLYSFNYYPKINIDFIGELTTTINGFNVKVSTNSQISISFNYIYFYLRLLTSGEKVKVSLKCENKNSVTKCSANLDKFGEGIYFVQYDNICGKTVEYDTAKISDKNTQILNNISPDFVKINSSDVVITLTYKNNFSDKNKPTKIVLINKKTNKLLAEDAIFDKIGYEKNTITFTLPSKFSDKTYSGEYKIKTIFVDENSELISVKTLLIADRLSLYEKKQRIVQSNETETKIGIIFNTKVSLDRIDKVTFKNIEIDKNDIWVNENNTFSNVLMINTTKIINFTQVGFYYFKIYEKNVDEPLIYTFEIYEERGLPEYDIILNNYIYKNTEDLTAYITVSVSDDYPLIECVYNENQNNTAIATNKLWTNTYVFVINIIEGSFSFRYSALGSLDKIPLNKTVYVFKDLSTFIDTENFDECQINYCPFRHVYSNENTTDCFLQFFLQFNFLRKRSEIIVRPDQLYFGLYSLTTKKTYEIAKVYQFSHVSIRQNLTNDEYMLQLIRKDIVDDEPVVIFQKPVTLTNLKINNLTYDNYKLTANFSTLCYNSDHIRVDDTVSKECVYNEDNKNLICEFGTPIKIKRSYPLFYFNNYIDTISTVDGFVCDIFTIQSPNGKARFNIRTVNVKFGALNITSVKINDLDYEKKTESNEIEFTTEKIYYEKDNFAYVEIGEIELSKNVYISSITLFDGNSYYYNSSNTNKFTFNKLKGITPNYLYSYEDFDDISFIIEPTYTNAYLIYDGTENKISCSKREKGYTCLASSIEYGIDYHINYYQNIILHTIKTSFDKRCYSTKSSHNIIFTLQSQNEINNISNFKVKLYNKKTGKEETNRVIYSNHETEDGNHLYNFIVKPQNLQSGYYLMDINGQRLTGSNITINDGKTIVQMIGDLITYNGKQYFLLKFNESLSNYEITKVFLKRNNNYIYGYCDDPLDNKKLLICQINDPITESGYYTLGHFDECSNEITSSHSIQIKQLSIPYPNKSTIKHVIKSSDSYTISFNQNNGNMNSISNIKLIKTSNLNENNVLSFYENGGNIIFTIPTNNDLGNYLIKIIYDNGVIIVSPLVSIYDSDFDIKYYNPEIRITNFNIQDYYIKFKGKYNENQIKKAYVIYDQYESNEQTLEISFEYDKNKNSVKIKENLNIIDKEQLHFEFVGDITTYSYYFHILPNNIYINFVQPYLLLHKNHLYLDIYNYGQATYLSNIVISYSTNDGMTFKPVYCYDYLCRLVRTSFSYSSNTVKELKLNFKNTKKLNVNSNNIYIIPPNYIQQYLPFQNNFEYSKYKEEPYFTNYRAAFYFKNPNSNDYHYHNLANSYDIHQYKVLFPYSEYQYYTYDHFENTITLNFESNHYSHSLIMRNPTNHNNFIIAKVNNFQCLWLGFIYYIKNGKISCEKCSKLDPNRPYKQYYYCTSYCYYQFQPHMQCYDSCEFIQSDKKIYKENNKCVYECSDNYGIEFNSSLTCIKCSDIDKFSSKGYCKTCDEINEPWCRAPEYHDVDIKVPSCEYYSCNNGGFCYMKNFEAYCACPDGYYGLRCELNLEVAGSRAKNLVDDFLSVKDSGRISNTEDGELFYDLNDEKNIKQIREISNLMKEPAIAQQVGRKKVKELFHSVGNMIMKMVDGVVDLNANVLELFDLATNLVSSNLQMRGLLRNLDDEEEYDDINYIEEEDDEEDNTKYINEEVEEEIKIIDEEEIENLKDLLNKARVLYKKITFNDVEIGNFTENSAVSDYTKSRQIHYQRWYNNEESNKKMFEGIKGNDELKSIDFSTCTAKDTKIIYIAVSFSSKIRSVIEKYETKDYKITNSYTDAYDITNGVANAKNYYLTDCTNLTAYLPIDYSVINVEKYKLYKKANIDIYKKDDKAFCESCFITNGLNYDLTQKFRKKIVYDNKTIVSDDCVYDSIDIEFDKIKMYCKYKESFNYLYKIVETHLDNKTLNKVDNLPLKCSSYVRNIKNNIGFWLFFILTILVIGGITYSIKHFYDNYIRKIIIKHAPIKTETIYGSEKSEKPFNVKIYKKYESENEKIMVDDKSENDNNVEKIIVKKNKEAENNIINKENKNDSMKEESKEVNIKSIEKSGEQSIEKSDEQSSISNEISNDDNKNEHPFDNIFAIEENIKEEKKEEDLKEEKIEGIILEKENEEPFKKILIRNVFEYYPLISFCKESIYTNLFINICFFAFNIVLIFGGNAFFYFENIIEKRIPNNNRSKFIYPITKEIVKIIISIIFSMIGMLIIRLIIFIPRLKNKKIYQLLTTETNNDDNMKKEKKAMKEFYIRRIIACLIMLIFTVFTFYYVIVFCSLYKNTQMSWLISGVWSLLLEWVILCPLYILIISLVEKKGRSQRISSYYMKQLFLF